ncbi:hypothetical protein K1719_030929 [Acacia pycnantha]|nr:hypothetical protein K1719_030929 [Acacia pycnantha]
MEQVQQDLRQLIEGKKFLIVLDDVWNDNVELWRVLKSLLSEGAEGSMLIVTTRSEKVGKMMGTHPPIILEGLDGERSWELFCRMAFVEGREPNNNELIAVGMEIVNKCGGVPLAIRAVGSLVYEKTLEGITDLSFLRNCELWNVDELEERVFAVLKLSYDHLPSPLKNCVAFCSLFPKDFSFKKKTLIQMWLAEGFIQPTVSMRCGEVPTSLLEFEKSRTIILLNNEFDQVTNPSVFDLVGSKLKCLRVLNLNATSISKIPNNIGKLKHLRFLDLSRNCFRKVPEAITRLHNLQTLDLCDNYCLLELPRYISKLVSLKHLYITCCWDLKWMPRGLGQLTSLQTLTNFIVAEQEMPGSARISELGKLNNLRGTLTITWLSRLRSNHNEAESAKLGEKQHLQQLSLIWDTDHSYKSPKVVAEDELILERLCPHHTIKSLCIKGFCGERLPEWIGDLLELQHLVLQNCKYLTSLPEGLHNLTSLRTLTILDSPLLAGDDGKKLLLFHAWINFPWMSLFCRIRPSSG